MPYINRNIATKVETIKPIITDEIPPCSSVGLIPDTPPFATSRRPRRKGATDQTAPICPAAASARHLPPPASQGPGQAASQGRPLKPEPSGR